MGLAESPEAPSPTRDIAATDGPAPVVRIVIARSDPAARRTFEVRRIRPMMVLDALIAIQQQEDATIGFRFSCRVAMCGTCTIRIDGRPGLACQTPVADGGDIHLAPLSGLPVVRDLIIDTAPFLDEWARVKPWLVPLPDVTGPAHIRPDDFLRATADASLDCIQCGACFASCAVAESNRDFLGPAALTRAMVLIADERDGAHDERMAMVGGTDGIDRCHYAYGCTVVCPKGLDPAAAIRRLRRWRLEGRPR